MKLNVSPICIAVRAADTGHPIACASQASLVLGSTNNI